MKVKLVSNSNVCLYAMDLIIIRTSIIMTLWTNRSVVGETTQDTRPLYYHKMYGKKYILWWQFAFASNRSLWERVTRNSELSGIFDTSENNINLISLFWINEAGHPNTREKDSWMPEAGHHFPQWMWIKKYSPSLSALAMSSDKDTSFKTHPLNCWHHLLNVGNTSLKAPKLLQAYRLIGNNRYRPFWQ